MHILTPWSAMVQEDLQKSEILLEKTIHKHSYQFYNTGDSLWIVAITPENSKIAFRAAFAMSSCFEVGNIFDDQDAIVLVLNSRIGNYEVRVNFPQTRNPVLHYTTTFTARIPLLIPFWPRDIMPLTQNGSVENTSGQIHMQQAGTRTGLLFGSMTKPKKGSFFYFQNLTSISGYCEATQTELCDAVGGNWPELGFRLPTSEAEPLPAGKAFVLSDAYVVMTNDPADTPSEISAQFLNHLSAVYRIVPKPEVEYHHWLDIAQKVLHDLYHNKGCWTQTNGCPYLNAYLCDYDTPAESMVQLAVLAPFHEYENWNGTQGNLYADLTQGLSAFYDGKISSINRWLPELEEDLDKSEEQKKEKVMDSWYLHHPLMNLARLALQGDRAARKLVLDSMDYVIKVAHHFNYKWPVFYKMETLEVIKEETAEGEGGENDVAGSYAHLMLLVFKLTKEKRYLNEAEKGASKLAEWGTNVFYQANNTAFSAGALLELYKLTNNKTYLETSYACLAGLFSNMQIWDCQYGNGKNYKNFFSIFPLKDAPYTAAYEEMEVYAALSEYLIQAKDVEILPSLRVLIPEFVKYAVNRIAYYYPALLPEDMLSGEVKTGEIQPNLWIPLEDLYTGWEPSGKVGQEVYGAGLAFGVVPRQYIKIGDDFLIFIEYPLTRITKREDAVIITLDGDKEISCSLKIIKTGNKAIRLDVFFNNEPVKAVKKNADMHQYEIPGQGAVKVLAIN